jgi:hypothetical protein
MKQGFTLTHTEVLHAIMNDLVNRGMVNLRPGYTWSIQAKIWPETYFEITWIPVVQGTIPTATEIAPVKDQEISKIKKEGRLIRIEEEK